MFHFCCRDTYSIQQHT